jgi:signal transduction histidine kinase
VIELIAAASWSDTVRDRPGASAVAAAALVATAAGAGVVMRAVTARTRALVHLVVAITLVSLAIGAVAALVLSRLMVFDDVQTRAALGVLVVTAVVAIIFVAVATVPLGRDAQRLEASVRRIEHGDRTVRTGVRRADELGHVARALDDLTERLDGLEREQAAIEQERRLMFTSIGHDLRTPLSALRAAVEALADGIAPDPDRYLRSMVQDVEALGELIDDVFLLASIEAGRLDLEREPVDLAELADGAIEALAPAAARRDVSLRLTAPGSVRVQGNARAIGRVLRNLLDNAIRHAPAGSSVSVELTSDPAPVLRVVDEGPGFSPGFDPFAPFSRADPSRTRSTGGSGLGLVIARGLIEAHGGTVAVERADPAKPGARVQVSFAGNGAVGS